MKKYFPGARVGRLTLLEELRLPGIRLRWTARCACGSVTSVYSSALSQTQSCGCLQRETASAAMIDMAGRTIGFLTVLRENGRDESGRTLWLCRCRCGREVTLDGSCLRRHESRKKARGCSQQCTRRKYAIDANLSQGGAYQSWNFMMRRCFKPTSSSFPRYGGRGITVYERWRDFVNFFADMGERPPGHTLGRINNDGNYEPDNCRWETLLEQSRNKSTNRHASFTCPGGCGHTTTMTISEWERALSVGRQLQPSRYDNGKRNGK